MKFRQLIKKSLTLFALGSLFIVSGCSGSSNNANEDLSEKSASSNDANKDLSEKEAFLGQLFNNELFPTRIEMESVLRANEEPGALIGQEILGMPLSQIEPNICNDFGVVDFFSSQSPRLGRFFYTSDFESAELMPDVVYQFQYLYAANLDSTIFQSEIDRLGDVFYKDSEERCSTEAGVMHESSETEYTAQFEDCWSESQKLLKLNCVGSLEAFGGKWSRTAKIESGWFPETPRQTLGIFNIVSRTSSMNARFVRTISIITIPKADAAVVLTSTAYNARYSNSKVSLDAMTETLANIAREAKERMINKILSSPTWGELQQNP